MASWQDSVGKTFSQLRDLSISQKLTIFLGAALIALSLLWMGHWASTTEYVPLLNQDMTPSELDSARNMLESLNVPAKVQGAKLFVAGNANRSALIAQLGLSDKLPGDTSIGFSSLVKEANPWLSGEENNKRWTVALAGELERIVREFQGVKDARVMLNLNGPKRGFSRNEPTASAGVFITMKAGEPVSRQLALAAARLVSGAVRGLPLRNVQVVDGNGAVALDWEQESAGSNSIDRLRREQEGFIADKIRAQLAFDPAVRVSVRVELDATARQRRATQTTEGAEIRNRTRSEETTRGRAAAVPGVQPNVGSAIGGGSSADRSVTSETEVENQPSVTQTDEHTAAGDTKEVFAAVLLSHSFLTGIIKRNDANATDITPEQIDAEFKQQAARVVNQVKQLVKPQADSQVAVDWYYDALVPPSSAPDGSTATAVPLELIAQYGPASGLTLLALLSIGFVLRLARRGSSGEAFGIEIGLPREAIERARRAAGDIASAVGGGVRAPVADTVATAPVAERAAPTAPAPVGQEAEGLLEAQEVDEDTVQVRTMVEQITKMAEADSDSMAALLEKWVDRRGNMR